MTLKKYTGSCHCGAVRFEADIDLSKGTNKCNCSICAKARAWFTLVQPEHFRLTSGADVETEYQWTPAGHPGSNLHYHFCRTCGIRTVGRGEHGPKGGPFYFVAVASLDDVDEAELAAAPINYMDGKHDHYDRPPKETRLM